MFDYISIQLVNPLTLDELSQEIYNRCKRADDPEEPRIVGFASELHPGMKDYVSGNLVGGANFLVTDTLSMFYVRETDSKTRHNDPSTSYEVKLGHVHNNHLPANFEEEDFQRAVEEVQQELGTQ